MPPAPTRSCLLGAVLAAGALALVPAVARAAYVPGQVVVRYAKDVDASDRASLERATGTDPVRRPARGRTRLLAIRDGASVAETVRELRGRPGVAAAAPNHIARASVFLPDDPGRTGRPGGWAQLQWNFLDGPGINAPGGWDNLIRAGAPGGRGVTVAVLDTGVAVANRGEFRRSPDLAASRLRRGYDFVDGDDRPDDENGHGTHVASTIGESTDNGVGVTGIAYGATIMPIRVLDATGAGDSVDIARGIRFAARRGAKIINLSFEFSEDVTGASIPDVLAALRYAARRGALVVGASGNASARAVAYPARSALVMSVGAVTEHGCQAAYSNRGAGLDISAPGGGPDADVDDDPNCRPAGRPGRPIYQLTFDGSVRRFGLPSGYVGTSMAAPHVSAVAALVVASRVIGRDPSPRRLRSHLQATARPVGSRSRYGAGLVDAARATAAAD